MLAALSAKKLELGVDLVRRLFFVFPFPAALTTRFNDAAGFFGKPIVSAGTQPAVATALAATVARYPIL